MSCNSLGVPNHTLTALFLLVGKKGLGSMGYQDAVRDGIRIAEEHKTLLYYPPCHLCGAEIRSWVYLPDLKYVCKECEELKRLKKNQERAEKRAKERVEKGIVKPPTPKQQEKIEKAKTKNEAMMDRAIKRINKISSSVDYAQAIEKVKSEMEAGVVFQSTSEVLAALELSRKRVKYRTQVQFGPYRADFVLDTDKVVLEIDGKMFHAEERKFKEQIRDGLIIAALGPQWEVVRIPDDNINKHLHRLTQAISRAIDHRKLTRSREEGFIRRAKSG